MKPLLSKPCRICGTPVMPHPRKTRKAFYYPRQCEACYKKPRDPEARIQRLKATFAKQGHPNTKPIGTRSLRHSRASITYWLIKVAPTGKWPYEHRWLMEQKLGRPLRDTEHVHHINHDTLDNREENLVVLSHSAHTTLHHSIPATQWSKRYAACIHCHLTTSTHASKGLCNTCYQRKARLQNPDKYRAYDRARWPARSKTRKR